MKGLGLALAAAVVATTAAVPSANAFCRSTTCVGECARDFAGCKTEGLPLYWPGLCVSFSLDEHGSEHLEFAEFERIAEASVAAWSDVLCEGETGSGPATISFVRKADVACHKAEYNEGEPNANIILFQDSKWSYTGIDNTLAKTTVTYDTDTGEILDADIELNHAYNEFTTGDDYVAYDLQSILTHEFGHFIGLDHTDDLSATMNPGYQEGTTELRTIAEDDEAAVCTAYPPDRDVTCRPEPNGGFTKMCAGEKAPEEVEGCSIAPSPSEEAPNNRPWLAAVALAGAAALSRRLRRRRTGERR
jgi:hypothetical protein